MWKYGLKMKQVRKIRTCSKASLKLRKTTTRLDNTVDGILLISGYVSQNHTLRIPKNIFIQIASELDVDISKSNIDGRHRVGKPTQQQQGRSAPDRPCPRDILVKFSTYNARPHLYEMRKELCYSEDDTMKHLFINEDLTK